MWWKIVYNFNNIFLFIFFSYLFIYLYATTDRISEWFEAVCSGTAQSRGQKKVVN